MMKEFTIVKNGERVFDRTQGKYVTSNPTKTEAVGKLNYLNSSKAREIFGDIATNVIVIRNPYPDGALSRNFDYIIVDGKTYRIINQANYSNQNATYYFSQSNDTVDSELEDKPDNDTIYDDTEIKQLITNINNKISGLSEKVTALEAREDKDTVYDDTEIKERISALEDKPDKDTIYDDSNLKSKIDELESKLQSLNTVRRAPTGYTLDRTTVPWTIWFDNGCGLQMPDYSPTKEQELASTIYGFGYSLNLMTTTVGTYPVPQNFIAASMGHISLKNFSKQNANDFRYFSPSMKVINPVRNDAEKIDWSHCYGEVNEDNSSLKRKHVFPRVCYELGIWSEADVLYLGATKK